MKKVIMPAALLLTVITIFSNRFMVSAKKAAQPKENVVNLGSIDYHDERRIALKEGTNRIRFTYDKLTAKSLTFKIPIDKKRQHMVFGFRDLTTDNPDKSKYGSLRIQLTRPPFGFGPGEFDYIDFTMGDITKLKRGESKYYRCSGLTLLEKTISSDEVNRLRDLAWSTGQGTYMFPGHGDPDNEQFREWLDEQEIGFNLYPYLFTSEYTQDVRIFDLAVTGNLRMFVDVGNDYRYSADNNGNTVFDACFYDSEEECFHSYEFVVDIAYKKRVP